MTKLAYSLCLPLALMSHQTAFALSCPATVDRVRVQPEGTVVLTADVPGGQVEFTLCELNGSMNVDTGSGTGPKTITTQTCQAYMAGLLSAKATTKQVTIWTYGSACTSMPTPFPYVIDF